MSQNWMDYILATGIGQRRTTEAILTLRGLYRKQVKKQNLKYRSSKA